MTYGKTITASEQQASFLSPLLRRPFLRSPLPSACYLLFLLIGGLEGQKTDGARSLKKKKKVCVCVCVCARVCACACRQAADSNIQGMAFHIFLLHFSPCQHPTTAREVLEGNPQRGKSNQKKKKEEIMTRIILFSFSFPFPFYCLEIRLLHAQV